jgi:molybdate transport system ATP-binding protein
MSLVFRNRHLFSRNIRFYSSKTLVQLENAQVHRFGAKEPAFKNLSLTLNKDEHLVIVGPVSAGKTTLAEVISIIPNRENMYKRFIRL